MVLEKAHGCYNRWFLFLMLVACSSSGVEGRIDVRTAYPAHAFDRLDVTIFEAGVTDPVFSNSYPLSDELTDADFQRGVAVASLTLPSSGSYVFEGELRLGDEAVSAVRTTRDVRGTFIETMEFQAPNCVPSLEACNGADDDCDFLIDESLDDPTSACGLPQVGSGVCTDGSCEIDMCEVGFGDCDGLAATGCETDTDSTDAHCGECGVVCAAEEVCSFGECRQNGRLLAQLGVRPGDVPPIARAFDLVSESGVALFGRTTNNAGGFPIEEFGESFEPVMDYTFYSRCENAQSSTPIAGAYTNPGYTLVRDERGPSCESFSTWVEAGTGQTRDATGEVFEDARLDRGEVFMSISRDGAPNSLYRITVAGVWEELLTGNGTEVPEIAGSHGYLFSNPQSWGLQALRSPPDGVFELHAYDESFQPLWAHVQTGREDAPFAISSDKEVVVILTDSEVTVLGLANGIVRGSSDINNFDPVGVAANENDIYLFGNSTGPISGVGPDTISPDIPGPVLIALTRTGDFRWAWWDESGVAAGLDVNGPFVDVLVTLSGNHDFGLGVVTTASFDRVLLRFRD